ncbi:MAG: hypothetical protein HYV63_16750 [Candidatus Schekmanbacteria bacterium]|nr:hypothetical protein [Candidatus Schekmanbacteria bacterium]
MYRARILITSIVALVGSGLLAGAPAHAVAPWSVQRNALWRANLRSVYYSPGGLNGYAVGASSPLWLLTTSYNTGEDALILATTDGGETWQEQVSGVSGDLRAVTCVAGGACWAVGDAVLRTTNSGVSWEQQSSSAPGALDVAFFNATSGCIAGDEAIYCTADGGATFAPTLAVEGTQFETLSALAEGAVGWAAGVHTAQLGANPQVDIYRTGDAGQSWQPMATVSGAGATPAGCADLWFFDELAGLLVAHGAAARTTDGGETFSAITELDPMPVLATNPACDLAFADATTGFLSLGRTSVVYRTTDGGAHWGAAAKVQPSLPIADLSATTGLTVTMAGDGGALGRSSDGGQSWELGDGGPTVPRLQLRMRDSERAWAAGPGPVVERTTDGGVSWELLSRRLPLPPTPFDGPGEKVRIATFGESYTWVLKDDPGRLWATTDGGETWELRSAGACAESIAFGSELTGWCLGPGLVYGTTDGGFSWSSQAIGAAGGGALAAIDETHAWAVFEVGRVLKTANGTTWQPVFATGSGVRRGVSFFDSLSGWIAGTPALRTTDGGATWQDMAAEASLRAGFWSGTSGFLMSDERLYWSSDGGASAQEMTRFSAALPLLDLAVRGNETGLASSDGGRIEASRAVMPPDGLQVQSVGADGARLVWAPGMGTIPEGYHVYRSLASTQRLARLTAVPVTATSYLDKTIAGDTSYVYAVTAVQAEVESGLGQRLGLYMGTPQSETTGGGGERASGALAVIYRPDGQAITPGSANPEAGVECGGEGFAEWCFIAQPAAGTWTVRAQAGAGDVAIQMRPATAPPSGRVAPRGKANGDEASRGPGYAFGLALSRPEKSDGMLVQVLQFLPASPTPLSPAAVAAGALVLARLVGGRRRRQK